MAPSLSVSIAIQPRASEISIEELNQLFAGELVDFERWFMQQQRDRGVLEPSPLISAENAILRSFMYYLSTKEQP